MLSAFDGVMCYANGRLSMTRIDIAQLVGVHKSLPLAAKAAPVLLHYARPGLSGLQQCVAQMCLPSLDRTHVSLLKFDRLSTGAELSS